MRLAEWRALSTEFPQSATFLERCSRHLRLSQPSAHGRSRTSLPGFSLFAPRACFSRLTWARHQTSPMAHGCFKQAITLKDPSEYARPGLGCRNYKEGLSLRARGYRTRAATCGDWVIFSDQLTPRMKGSGNTPITIVASAATPTAQRIPKLTGIRPSSIGALISIEFAIFR